MTIWDLRQQFPALVEDRIPEVAYELSRWLLEEPRSPQSDDWLVAAFDARSLRGKSFRPGSLAP